MSKFKKGNTVGEETRFQNGNTKAAKYLPEYGEQMISYFKTHEGFPTFELFAEKIGVTNDTLLNWRDKYPRFRNYYARCKNIQKGNLIEGAMAERYNPAFAKFIAINNHDMKDKVEADINKENGYEVNIHVIK